MRSNCLPKKPLASFAIHERWFVKGECMGHCARHPCAVWIANQLGGLILTSVLGGLPIIYNMLARIQSKNLLYDDMPSHVVLAT